jgi:hypothetical protein
MPWQRDLRLELRQGHCQEAVNWRGTSPSY